MTVSCEAFNKDGSVQIYTLTNAKKTMTVKISTFGARVNNLIVQDKDGRSRDVCVGFDSYEDLVDALDKNCQYFGATIGRCAGRISHCKEVRVENQTCCLTVNKPGEINLHGGLVGWDSKIWDAKVISEYPAKISMSYVSLDGEQGFCGKVKLTVTFEVTDKNELKLDYLGELLDGEASLMDPTNHIYFNLSGFEDHTVRSHLVQMDAYGVLETNDDLEPQGWINPVEGTPFDFRKPRRIGEYVDWFPKDHSRGYDHPFIIDKPKTNDGTQNRPCKKIAKIVSEDSGIEMIVRTDEPCIVFYTGNYISSELKGKGNNYENYCAFAFEPQRYCNSICFPYWKDMFTLKKGQTYEQSSVYEFTASQ